MVRMVGVSDTAFSSLVFLESKIPVPNLVSARTKSTDVPLKPIPIVSKGKKLGVAAVRGSGFWGVLVFKIRVIWDGSALARKTTFFFESTGSFFSRCLSAVVFTAIGSVAVFGNILIQIFLAGWLTLTFPDTV